MSTLLFTMVHLLGFAGSALIVTGVMMRRVEWLRAFGLAGSLTFIVYGILLGAWPIVVTNVTTTSLHLFHLQAHVRTRRHLRATAEHSGANLMMVAPLVLASQSSTWSGAA